MSVSVSELVWFETGISESRLRRPETSAYYMGHMDYLGHMGHMVGEGCYVDNEGGREGGRGRKGVEEQVNWRETRCA